MTGITQYLPNKNLTFQSHFYMLRMKFNTDLTCIMGKILLSKKANKDFFQIHIQEKSKKEKETGFASDYIIT